MSILQRMGQIDRRIIYVLLVIVVLIPLKKPIGLPLSVSSWVTQTFEAVEELKPGDTVLVSFDYQVGGAADLQDAVNILFKHLMDKDVRVIAVAFIDQGPQFVAPLMDKYAEEGKVYGVDFVNLGFVAGGETALAAFYADMSKAVPSDVKGVDTRSYPIMEGISSAADVNMVIGAGNVNPGPHEWVRQMQAYKMTPLVIVTSSSNAALAEPYVQAKQAVGLIAGMKGAAEYEKMCDIKGGATAGMDAQSAAHILLVLLILLGNVSYLSTRNKKAN